MPSIVLSRGELIDLTDKVQVDAQKAELRAMGIDFYERENGSLAVLRATVEGREKESDTSTPIEGKPWIAAGVSPHEWLKSNARDFMWSDKDIVTNAAPYEFGQGPDDTGIYFIVNKGKIIYVGRAKQISVRLAQHHDQCCFPVEHYFHISVPQTLCESVESYYINRIRPPENIAIPPPYMNLEKYL